MYVWVTQRAYLRLFLAMRKKTQGEKNSKLKEKLNFELKFWAFWASLRTKLLSTSFLTVATKAKLKTQGNNSKLKKKLKTHGKNSKLKEETQFFGIFRIL